MKPTTTPDGQKNAATSRIRINVRRWLRKDIVRRIGNNMRIHAGSHPFKSGRSGMEDFAFLAVMFTHVTDGELCTFLETIDRLTLENSDCVPCRQKLHAFSLVFAGNRLPALKRTYRKRYEEGLRDWTPGRDFLAEVQEAVDRHRPKAEKWVESGAARIASLPHSKGRGKSAPRN